MSYTYIVYFDRMIHGIVVTSKCKHVDLSHAKRYVADLQKKGEFFNLRIEKL